jgi:hypothetical protein
VRIESYLAWILLLLAACTKAPATITQAQLSKTTYADWACEQLAAERTRLSIASTLAATGDETSKAMTDKDSAAGVDQKGMDQSLELAMHTKECTKSPRPIVASVAQQPSSKPAEITKSE